MMDYGGGSDAQRNAITAALVNNVSPSPRTVMPPPQASMMATMAMPGRQPPGLAGQAGVAPTALGGQQPPAVPGAAPLPPMGSMPGGLMQPLAQPLAQPLTRQIAPQQGY